MFTKAKYGEYQITPNLMHAHAMHLRQSYYETRHYESTKLEELHYRVKHLSCRILRYCVTRERIYDKRRDSHALAELGAKTPINQLFEELQDIHEEYEAEYKRLNITDPPITPLGIPNNLTGEGVEEAVAVMENLARQGVNLHWQAVRFASTCRMLEAQKWLEEFIRTLPPQNILARRLEVDTTYFWLNQRAMNEAKQAGWLAVEQARRINHGDYPKPTREVLIAQRTYEAETAYLTNVNKWFNEPTTQTWLHLPTAEHKDKKTLWKRIKTLLHAPESGTQPKQFPKSPVSEERYVDINRY